MHVHIAKKAHLNVCHCVFFAYLQLSNMPPLFAPAALSIAAGGTAFPSFWRACLLSILLKHRCTLSWSGRRERDVDNPSPTHVCLRWSATTALAPWREGGEERRWREFRKSSPNKVKLFHSSSFCSYWISAAPPHNKPVLSFTLPSSLWCCFFTLSAQLQASCEAVFPSLPPVCSLFTHFWLLQIVFTSGALTVSAPHFSLCHYFPRCNFWSIVAHSSRWK